MTQIIEWQRAMKCEECNAVSDSATFCARCGSQALWSIAKMLDNEVKIMMPVEEVVHDC